MYASGRYAKEVLIPTTTQEYTAMIKIAATRGAGTVYTRAYVEVGVIDIGKATDIADAKIANIASSGGWENASTDDKL